ncbi:hypothetical protein CLV44_11774 [Marinobacterium halophilum]|uniref:Uncharacterized protein n=1 Tax=Marinobacterium halophilum TaxID=267374 RepID=A0A2P8ESY6_9GAMM|nr:hypothetical protein [Marinobacterium halophilum]PSL12545.1 hypothetical protein CLV44_11774 [Marinobacterium halophilum]
MDNIQLQSKTKALKGSVEAYWFENENIGLEKTLFHRISIPLAAFDSSLDYEKQSVETEIFLDWYKLDLSYPDDLDGLNLKHASYPDAEGSVYVGSAHNWCDVKRLVISKNYDASFSVVGEVFIEFENEGVAKNEIFKFETNIEFIKA